jgi:hypothetical protein
VVALGWQSRWSGRPQRRWAGSKTRGPRALGTGDGADDACAVNVAMSGAASSRWPVADLAGMETWSDVEGRSVRRKPNASRFHRRWCPVWVPSGGAVQLAELEQGHPWRLAWFLQAGGGYSDQEETREEEAGGLGVGDLTGIAPVASPRQVRRASCGSGTDTRIERSGGDTAGDGVRRTCPASWPDVSGGRWD